MGLRHSLAAAAVLIATATMAFAQTPLTKLRVGYDGYSMTTAPMTSSRMRSPKMGVPVWSRAV